MKKILLIPGTSLLLFGAMLSSIFYNTNTLQPNRSVASIITEQKSKAVPKLFSLKETQKYIRAHDLAEVEYSGFLVRESIDLFHQSQYIERYYLQNDRERIQINPLNKEKITHLNGKEIKLTGWHENQTDILHGFVEEEKIQSRLTANNPLSFLRTERMLVVLADFYDSTPLPTGPNAVTLDTIGDFLNSKVFQSYFDFTYQGRVKNKITKVVPYTFRRNCADKVLSSTNPAPGYMDNEDMNTIFEELNLNPKDYENISVLANCNSNWAWGIGSVAIINGVMLTTSHLTMWPSYFIYGSPTAVVPYMPILEEGWSFIDGFIHERMHTYGHLHANGLDCGASQTFTNCKHLEYQNPFDVMGARNPAYNLNSHMARIRNARSPSQYITITKPGVYTIDALETTNFNSVVAAYIKIPEIQDKVFMVEHRLPMGFDKNLMRPAYQEASRGLLLYSSINPSIDSAPSYYDHTFRLIDPYPAPSNVPFIERVKTRSIVPEKPYFDLLTGVRITVLEDKLTLNRIKAAPYSTAQAQKKTSISFRVDFDKENRACLNAKLPQIVEPFRFIVNGRLRDPNEVVVLKPTDVFNIFAKIHKTDPEFCPYIEIETKVEETAMITSWSIPKEGDNNGQGNTPEDDYDPTTNVLTNIFRSVESSTLITGNMRVPANPPVGTYTMPVTYSNPVTGESFKSTLTYEVINR